MENVSDEIKTESINSIQSTIKKSENALAQMSQQGANLAKSGLRDQFNLYQYLKEEINCFKILFNGYRYKYII